MARVAATRHVAILGGCVARGGGGQDVRLTALKVLHGLATSIVHAMEPWLPPAQPRLSVVWPWCNPSDLQMRAFATIFIDVALDIFRYQAGAFIPKMNAVRSNVIPPSRHNQQSAELRGFCWAIRLAGHVGWHCMFLLTDSR